MITTKIKKARVELTQIELQIIEDALEQYAKANPRHADYVENTMMPRLERAWRDITRIR